MGKEPIYIEEPLHITDLFKFHDQINEVRGCLVGLGEGGDIPQRASDLYGAIESLKELAEQLLLDEED